MNFLFPAVFAANMLAMTALLISFGLAGDTAMAADIGIVQGATLALFYALSANVRSLILNHVMPASAHAVLLARLMLMLPLAGVTFWLSTVISGVDAYLTAVLILRRCVEWLGEVHLSELERAGNKEFAVRYLISQSLLLLFALAWKLGDMPLPLFGLFLWAFLPLLFSARFIRDAIFSPLSELRGIWKRMLPHFGSTAIIGISVYVFRLLLLMILGKHAAGDLFTAFAIGGIIGSVFANALGPSIVLQERTKATKQLPLLLNTVIFSSLVLGLVLVAVSLLGLDVLDWSGKSNFFWETVGFSMLGGVIMIYAQLIRFRLLQSHHDEDLFGPDLIVNILIIMSVPLLFDIFGVKIFTTLYLQSSLLALIFYWSYKKGEQVNESRPIILQERIRASIAVMLLLPLFFQLGSGVFIDSSMKFNSGGILSMLPIPLSVFACYGGILLLGGYRRASISLSFIFFTCLLMVGSFVIGSQALQMPEKSKFILLIQYVIPMFGLVLGQLFESRVRPESASFEKAFVYTLAVIIPLQLLSTWLQGYKLLSPYLYIFSIYQHLQYVPVVFAAAFLIALCRLWAVPKFRRVLFALVILMSVYVAASISMLAIMMLWAGLLGFAIFQFKNYSDKLPLLLLVVSVVLTWGYLKYEKDDVAYKFHFLNGTMNEMARSMSDSEENKNEAAPNITERFRYWKYYGENIATSPKTFFIGHVEPPNRALYPSAHNYYLDFIYNFGMLALLPLLALLLFMLIILYRNRREVFVSPGLISLAAMVLFLMLVDNSLKVGFRQPYPGIFSFFLMGVLISRLSEINAMRVGKPKIEKAV